MNRQAVVLGKPLHWDIVWQSYNFKLVHNPLIGIPTNKKQTRDFMHQLLTSEGYAHQKWFLGTNLHTNFQSLLLHLKCLFLSVKLLRKSFLDTYLLDVSSFSDSTANWSEPKNSSLQGGPEEVHRRRCDPTAPLRLLKGCTQQCWRRRKDAIAVLPFVNIMLRLCSSKY